MVDPTDEKLYDATKAVLEGFDSGVFVRSTKHDADPTWGLKLFPYIKALATLNEAVMAHGVTLPTRTEDRPNG